MTIRIVREPSISGTTFGCVFVDGRFFAFSLEDEIRERVGAPVSAWKVPGQTAIPAGRYRVHVTPSPRFGRLLPLIAAVPGFSGIRIHPINAARETDGCIGVGHARSGLTLRESADACAELQDQIEAALGVGDPVWIAIENPPQY